MIFPVIILALVVPYLALSKIYRKVVANRAMSRLVALTIEQTARHSMALVTKERQTVYKDEYGNTVFEAMDREIDRYIKSTVLRKAVPGDYLKASSAFDVKDALQGIVYDRLYAVHIPFEDEKDADGPLAIPDDHKAFENWCAQTLEHQGWEARVVGGAGDQGADVIGTKDGIQLVVQCKRWAASVTNRAVQEVAAARVHNGADQAMVVSVSGFTPSARQLASTNRVFLIDAVAFANGAEILN